MVVLDRNQPERMIAARSGSPLVVGYGIGENFIASDLMALLPVTRRFAYLEEGDVAEITRTSVQVFDLNNDAVVREASDTTVEHEAESRSAGRSEQY